MAICHHKGDNFLEIKHARLWDKVIHMLYFVPHSSPLPVCLTFVTRGATCREKHFSPYSVLSDEKYTKIPCLCDA